MSYKVFNVVPPAMMDGIRIIYRSARRKDAGVNMREIEVKVSYGPLDFMRISGEMGERLEFGQRIYASVVPRDFQKARKEFARRKLDADYSPETAQAEFYKHVEREWRRSLGASPLRAANLFLLDLDTKAEIDYYYAYIELGGSVETLWPDADKWEYKTKNGVHVVFKPCNLMRLPEILRTKVVRDGMFLVAYQNEGQP